MKKIEFQNQAALVAWANTRATLQPELRFLFHVPNGGSRHPIEAANLKRIGVRRGLPDLCLPVKRREYIGLWIEMKAPDGRSSPEQREWHEFLRREGHRVEVCHDWIAARDIIIEYLAVADVA
jgi:hypothetical protein